MRPLPKTQRRRAALISLGGHGTLLALLLLLGRSGEPTFSESPLIMAELITLNAPSTEPTVAIESGHDERAGEPPSAPQPETEPVPEAVEPAVVERVVEPAAAPEPAVEPALERPTEPPPAERVVEVEVPSAPEPQAASEEADATATVASAAAAADPTPESRTLLTHEERAVRRRLSSWTGRFDPREADSPLTWRDAGQEYTAVLKQIPAADAMGMEQLAVELTTERDGERLATELRMNRVAFSNFAQFIDRWDPNVQIHDDFIDGRFHSNTEIRVSREGGVRPIFNGKVTLAAGDFSTDGVGYVSRRAMFPAGLETNVRRIVLPRRAATFDVGTVEATRLTRFERDSSITFHADGTFSARDVEAGSTAEPRALGGDEPFYLVGGDDVTLYVRGTVNGKVLVYSPGRIVIDDDLRYADDPRQPGASDYLGLVAERSVEIDEPEVTGPGDLEVHASIYARSRFLVRSYRSRRSGTLVIYGSVAAGSVSATEPRFGTRIEFDDRLTTMRAPGFPLSDRYELDSWSGEWRVAPTE